MSILYQFEKLCIRLRHSPLLKQAAPLWCVVRPIYDQLIRLTGKRGLVRNINGTDPIMLSPECRSLGEVYEPEVWAQVMRHIGPGSRVLDVGAHFGLYAMAFGHRVGPGGHVLAAEPDPENLAILRQHIQLNGLDKVVQVVPVALSDSPGKASLSTNSLQSHVSDQGSVPITLSTLDHEAGDDRWDLLLVDVEGHEEKVLRGGRQLLADSARRPSMILIEVHPYAWAEIGTTSDSLLEKLTENGYQVRTLNGNPVTVIEHYGHIVATQP